MGETGPRRSRLLHRRRILHRDITPKNIFLNTLDHALLGDFGLAVNLDVDGTAPGAGNQRYRAPEGFGGRMTTRSDLFSVGATLWHLLSGEWPYDAHDEQELVGKMLAAKRPRLRDLAPHVTRSLAEVVEQSLHPDPAERPATASEMAHQLSNARFLARSWRRVADPLSTDFVLRTNAGASLELRVSADGRLRQIETRRIGTGARVNKGCAEVTPAKVATELRRILDRL